MVGQKDKNCDLPLKCVAPSDVFKAGTESNVRTSPMIVNVHCLFRLSKKVNMPCLGISEYLVQMIIT